ncbi:TrmB family transcriptional regulator [Candidatus Woesearchaeota archaeon]|jgi:predicted transcriptional regulator|nr:TrmB family transcriptional regulator [Candidatus Woesearchaeota archaeon]MBT4367980.1 TrmB family transcriptional regulator [Candidatus Woesearchaeota archaeon]MBT4712468.1 TrmB family transcriptional regulator [Candidatus Woesearchaeota archaeon]MBT6639381.1 TrmB family transcriptional regulator [Candidatus Woesearchaeota archaeon]MBT7133553.1 TrmB family transcriptional regulator [Candidatus Woesearchaeota archaeon]
MKDALSNLGLSERESSVYLALLELGQTTTGPLSKKSSIPNSKIYEVLNSLEEKGLVSWVLKNNAKHFQPSPPEKILELFDEKRKRIKEEIDNLKKLETKENNYVKMFEGLKGMRSAFIEALMDLKPNQTIQGFATGESSSDDRVKLFYEWSGALRKEKKLISQLLISKKNEITFKKQHKITNNQYWQVKFTETNLPGDWGI